MMVKPVKKRAIQEWKMTEAEQPKEKVPEPTPAAVINHMEKMSRPAVTGILSPTAVMHPTHPFHIPPHGVVIQDPIQLPTLQHLWRISNSHQDGRGMMRQFAHCSS